MSLDYKGLLENPDFATAHWVHIRCRRGGHEIVELQLNQMQKEDQFILRSCNNCHTRDYSLQIRSKKSIKLARLKNIFFAIITLFASVICFTTGHPLFIFAGIIGIFATIRFLSRSFNKKIFFAAGHRVRVKNSIHRVEAERFVRNGNYQPQPLQDNRQMTKKEMQEASKNMEDTSRTMYIEQIGKEVFVHCYQSARSGDKYCLECGRVIDEELQSIFLVK